MRSNRDEYAKDPLCSNKGVLFLASKVRRGGGGTFTQVKATDLRLGDSMRACSQQQYHNNVGRRRAQQTTFNHPGSSAVARRVSPGLISVEVWAEWKSPTIHHNVPSNGLFGFLDTISCQLPWNGISINQAMEIGGDHPIHEMELLSKCWVEQASALFTSIVGVVVLQATLCCEGRSYKSEMATTNP